MAGNRRLEGNRHHLAFVVGVGLVVAALGPLLYCMGWIPGVEVQEATLTTCRDAHPLQFPTTILAAGLLSLGAGVVLRIQTQLDEQERLKKEKRLDRAVETAKRRAPTRTPMMDKKAMRGGRQQVPEAIEVDEELDLGGGDGDDGGDEEHDSIMEFLQENRQQQALRGRDDTVEAPEKGDGQHYVPPGMDQSPVLYLDAGVEPTPVDDPARRINNPNLPHVDIDEALEHAFRVMAERKKPVVVRVKPGVYQGMVEIPDRVSVVNHRLPAATSIDQRLRWLRQQHDIDHPDRVTFLAPADSEFGVRFQPGQKQGIFGCWLVGRSGIEQCGVQIRDCVASAVVNCAFESFAGGGARVIDSGTELEGRSVQFVGCVWQRNRAPAEGGGLRVERSAVRVEGSIFDSNRAPRGGAIAAIDTDKPLVVARSILDRNRALATEDCPSVEAMMPADFDGQSGIGGGLFVTGGLARVVDTNLEGNDATVGGGAVASIGARVVVKSTGPKRGECCGNRAAVGGGVLAAGWSGTPAMVRAREAVLHKNLAKFRGGAAAAIGTGVLALEEVTIKENRATGADGGVGGGVVAMRGGAAQLKGGKVTSNRAVDGGGGVGAVNGSLKIVGPCLITDNQAGAGGGGGVLAISAPDRRLDELMGRQGFSIPLKIQLRKVRITANRADGPGGGLRAGNRQSSSNVPVAVVVTHPNRINRNDTDSDHRLSHNLWIEWCGDLRVNDDVRGTVELALK